MLYNVSNAFRDCKSEPAQPFSIYLYIYKTQTRSLIFALLKQRQIYLLFCYRSFTKARLCLGLLSYEIKKAFYGNFHQRPPEFQGCHKVLKKYLETQETWFITCGNYGGHIRQGVWKTIEKINGVLQKNKNVSLQKDASPLKWTQTYFGGKKKKPSQYDGMLCFSTNTCYFSLC